MIPGYDRGRTSLGVYPDTWCLTVHRLLGSLVWKCGSPRNLIVKRRVRLSKANIVAGHHSPCQYASTFWSSENSSKANFPSLSFSLLSPSELSLLSSLDEGSFMDRDWARRWQWVQVTFKFKTIDIKVRMFQMKRD